MGSTYFIYICANNIEPFIRFLVELLLRRYYADVYNSISTLYMHIYCIPAFYFVQFIASCLYRIAFLFNITFQMLDGVLGTRRIWHILSVLILKFQEIFFVDNITRNENEHINQKFRL